MRSARRALALVASLLLLGPAAVAAEEAAGAPAVVERVDWEASPGGGRIVVVVRGQVQYSTHAASADPGAGLPPRAYVNLRPAKLGAKLARGPLAVDDGLLRRIRVGQFDPQTVRIVVDLDQPALFDVRTIDRPSRLLLSLRRGPGAAVATAPASPPPPAATPPASATTAAPASSVPAAAPTEPVRAEPAPRHDAADRPVVAATVVEPAAVAPEAPPPAPAPPERIAAVAPAATDRAPHEAHESIGSAPAPAASAAASDAPRSTPTPGAAHDAAATPGAAVAPPPPPPVIAQAPPPSAGGGKSRAGARGAAPRVVVLDPGHGGKDPGARGVTGDEEKNLTLAIAELVAERLRPDDRLRVVLTRTDDRTVTLEQRTAIANAQGADLFVSIHANASENPALAGIETYTLNNTDDRATIRLAAMENGLTLAGASPGERDLAYILSDLLQTGKEDESVALAESVHRETVRHLRAHWKGVESLGVKKGPFYVLVGAYMPCVLLEVGFMTHETEGQRVASRRYQRDLAEGIAAGIRRFLDSAPANANL